jgi:hypothetical protein
MKLLAALFIALGLITACGSSNGDVPTVGSASPAEEEVVVQQEDDAVIVDEEPADESTVFSNIPDDWPADLPVPEGGALEAWTVPFENDVRASWRLDGVSVMEAGDAYNTALESVDFTSREYSATETEAAGSYSNDERELTFTVSQTSDGAVSIYAEHRFLN